MVLMKAGQLEAVKLFDRPPSKKVGIGLEVAVAVAIEEDADFEDVEVLVEVSEAKVSDFEVLELPSDDAVDMGISNVVVTAPESALLLSSCSAGCSIVHPWSSRNGNLVSSMSSSMRSEVGRASGVGVGCGTPSRGANRRLATAVGTGSSSTGDARAIEANETIRHSAVAHCVRDVRLAGVGDAKTLAEGPERMGRS